MTEGGTDDKLLATDHLKRYHMWQWRVTWMIYSYWCASINLLLATEDQKNEWKKNIKKACLIWRQQLTFQSPITSDLYSSSALHVFHLWARSRFKEYVVRTQYCGPAVSSGCIKLIHCENTRDQHTSLSCFSLYCMSLFTLRHEL